MLSYLQPTQYANQDPFTVKSSQLRNAQGLFNDGLVTATCANNGQTTWIYNQVRFLVRTLLVGSNEP
jgi:hypothetical protein